MNNENVGKEGIPEHSNDRTRGAKWKNGRGRNMGMRKASKKWLNEEEEGKLYNYIYLHLHLE